MEGAAGEEDAPAMKAVYTTKNEPMRIAAFMSGFGSNLRKILETQNKLGEECPFGVVLVFSDVKDEERCNARKIAEEFGIEYYCNDIKDYYASRGRDRKDMGVRKEYDTETAKLLRKSRIDAVAMCGYRSITTGEIFRNFLTVNVHPADLRIPGTNGKKLYAGCKGAGCVRKAVESGRREMRATTHLVTEDVDGGPILTVSEPVMIDEKLSDEANLERLKELGDLKIYPETIKKLAEGSYWADENGIIIDIFQEKALLRERMRKLREKLGDNEVEEKSSEITKKLVQLEEYAKAKTVILYMGATKEVKTEEAVKAALGAGKRVAVPVSDLKNKRIIPTQLTSLADLKPGAYGILEPAGGKTVSGEEVELAIVPGLAFDKKGNRLGYGLGFYDRFLRDTNAKKVALAFDMQIVDRVPASGHDIAMDAIITEKRVIRCEA